MEEKKDVFSLLVFGDFILISKTFAFLLNTLPVLSLSQSEKVHVNVQCAKQLMYLYSLAWRVLQRQVSIHLSISFEVIIIGRRVSVLQHRPYMLTNL